MGTRLVFIFVSPVTLCTEALGPPKNGGRSVLLEVIAVRVCQSDQVESRERLQFETHHKMSHVDHV